ncbi:MAG: hypothetical protein BWY74_03906 [Firmicutes bacterium ADurb.Bin419]|nr:MAG: hypothetical protein BWY74_03906 [Firmicutes bacterium ADurb.Bin419]
MKPKIFYGILAIALAFSLSACDSGTSESSTSDRGTNGSKTISSSKSKPSTDLATVNKAYNDILNQYDITPISDGSTSTEYSIEDIIGDKNPELIIYDYYYQEENSTKDIYGYDNAKGETFRYIGETQLFNPQKGKGEYCVGVSDDGYYATYYIYEANDAHKIQEIQKFGSGNDPFGTWGVITYIIGTKNVDAELYKTEISNYMDVPALPKDAVKADMPVANSDDGTESAYNSATIPIAEMKSITLDHIKITLEKNCIFEGTEILESGNFKGTAKFYIQAVCPYCHTSRDDVIEQSSVALRGMMQGWGLMSLPLNDKVKCPVCGAEYTYYIEAEIIP